MAVKKFGSVLVVLILCMPMAAAGNFSLSLQGGIQFSGDSGFKEIYGGSHFLPGLKVQFSLNESLYAWAGAWRQSAQGTTPILEADADSCQRFLGVGAGWSGAFSNESNFTFYGEVGLLFARYSEESLGIDMNGNATGFRVAAGVRRDLGSSWFAGAGVAYGSAAKDIETITEETIRIKMGGFSLLLEVGLRF